MIISVDCPFVHYIYVMLIYYFLDVKKETPQEFIDSAVTEASHSFGVSSSHFVFLLNRKVPYNTFSLIHRCKAQMFRLSTYI